MIYIAICDDNEKLVHILTKRVKTYLRENNVLADLEVYTQSRLLQYDIQERKYFDLILSDIEMPNIDGMKLAAYIKQYLPDVLIIFITSYLKYAVDAFELSIFRYIPKNAIESRLPQALEDAINMINIQANDYYMIQMPSRIEKIPYKKILYIQREGKNSVITLTDGSITKVRKSLVQVFKEFKTEDFIYVDRGDIVNLAHVMGIKNGIVELKNGIRLPASHAKLEEIKSKLSDFWGEQI
ncbi:DNA-binding response regulator [Enterocloster clostridioformis]|nr:DNA-binding response regulator [Lachnoclostridium sp. YL32]NDO27681.1 response regulator transcription factor [Enterocloster clostridioformis]OXE70145.1 DNA-binding response regulator [Enterocloster clostridioformis]QQR00288.1 response regulator transcription factor [Enterocloster clostridioformis]